jgi:hypothetical protein
MPSPRRFLASIADKSAWKTRFVEKRERLNPEVGVAGPDALGATHYGFRAQRLSGAVAVAGGRCSYPAIDSDTLLASCKLRPNSKRSARRRPNARIPSQQEEEPRR